MTDTSPMNATVQYVHVFTPTLLNEAAIGFNRQWSVASTVGYLTTTQNINYALSVSGFTALTNSKSSESAPTTYSLLDNLTKTIGRYTIKTGFELKELQFNYSQAGIHQFQYNGVTQFQTNKLDSVSVVADVPVHGLHKLETFAYAQDTFKLRPNLTLTYGLRYAFLNVLHEVQGRSRAWDDVTCGGNCPVSGQFTKPVYADFEPRFSFGWEPAFLHGTTSLRGGFGIYHGEGQIGELNAPSDNYTTLFGLTPATFPGLSWPVDSFVAQAATNPSAVQPRGLALKRQDPRVTQYGLQIQTALPYRLILDTGYIGSWGDHQFTRTYKNNYLYGTTTRPYPAFGQVEHKDAISTTNFNAWQTSLQRQFRNNLGLQFNYMWSHSINDGTTGGGESDYPNNVQCLGFEYASSDQHARHTIWQTRFMCCRSAMTAFCKPRHSECLVGWDLFELHLYLSLGIAGQCCFGSSRIGDSRRQQYGPQCRFSQPSPRSGSRREPDASGGKIEQTWRALDQPGSLRRSGALQLGKRSAQSPSWAGIMASGPWNGSPSIRIVSRVSSELKSSISSIARNMVWRPRTSPQSEMASLI